MLKKFNPMMAVAQLALASANAVGSSYSPSRPSLMPVVEKMSPIGKRGRKGRQSFMMIERLIDQTRYPGAKLREIRKHGQAQECARRLARLKRAPHG